MVMSMTELRKCINELEDRYNVYISRMSITREKVTYKIYDRELKRSNELFIFFDDLRKKKDAIGYIMSYLWALCLRCEYERKWEYYKNRE